MKRRTLIYGGLALSLTLSGAVRADDANVVWLEDLDLSKMVQDFGQPQRHKSVDGNPLKLKGKVYEHGVGTHAGSDYVLDLKGTVTKFSATVGLDDEKIGSPGSIVFTLWADGKKVADSGVMKGSDEPKQLSADLTGAKRLALRVSDADDGIDSDHADWANAQFTLAPGATGKPVPAEVSTEAPPIFMGTIPEPGIHGPRLTGATVGRPFLFMIPATGDGPLSYAAKNLPAGLSLDSSTGIISGALQQPGKTVVEITLRGAKGEARRKLTIVGSEFAPLPKPGETDAQGKPKVLPARLALTPPLGWNSWNIFHCGVDEEKVRIATDWMVKSGLAAHGYQYVNIDDCWEDGRDANGEITVNKKFGDMKALGDYIHARGLKFGIYSSPGPKTCAGFEASYQHEAQDAKTYAKWGVDYLKYDWCSYGGVANQGPEGHEKYVKPYRIMGEALNHSERDIVFSLCQYGMDKVWEWGPQIGGNLWRTTDDIQGNYNSMANKIGFKQDKLQPYGGPGGWNDPDMLWLHSLRPAEQMTHMSLWCLQAAPLLVGSDLSKLTPFTHAVLTNDEVIDVDQDPLGIQGERKWPPSENVKEGQRPTKEGALEVWAKPLSDGTLAVGLFNRTLEPATVTARWSDLGLQGAQPVRDLWLRQDAGTFNDSYAVEVAAHGAALVKIGKPRQE